MSRPRCSFHILPNIHGNALTSQLQSQNVFTRDTLFRHIYVPHAATMLRCTCCLYTVAEVVHTLPEGKPVWGVTSLADEVYLLRKKERDQVEVYDVITYRLQRTLTLPDIPGFTDMTSCEHYRCLYIANYIADSIHRLDVGLHGAAAEWPVNDSPRGLSVNAAHNVLVTCIDVRKIKEFSSHGDLVRELTVPDDVVNPWHAIQTRNGEFIVCHGKVGDAVHRVCKMSVDGHHIVQSHGGQQGSATGHYKVPFRLAVDNNEFVFVVDVGNGRVTLLSPTLGYIRQVVPGDEVKWWPDRMCVDLYRRRLYVTANDLKYGKYTAGRVVVFNV